MFDRRVVARSQFTTGVALTCLLLVLSAGSLSAEDTETTEVKVKDITLTVPKTWKQEPPANKLRMAQFVIPSDKEGGETAELVISHFGGGGGGIAPNVQRWVGQFTPTGRDVKVTKGKSDQGDYVIADISGTYLKPVGPPVLRQTQPTPDSRMLAVILIVPDKGHYFLKLAGPDATVAGVAKAVRKSFGGDVTTEEPFEF